MMKYLTGLVIAVLLLSAIGCGHRKGAVSTSVSKGEHTRSMKVGDSFVYNVSVTSLRPNGSATQDGTVTVTVESGFKHGPIPSVVKSNFHLRQNVEIGNSATGEIDWVGQGSDGAIYTLGRLDQGTEWALVKDATPHEDTPAVLTDKSAWDYVVHMSNGRTETNVGKVVAVEKVSTPAGDLEAYKAETKTTRSDGNTVVGHTWLRPEFPLGVKVDQMISSKKSPKVKTRIVQTLKSYHLAE